MKKRILPLILCVCMLLSALAVGVLAAALEIARLLDRAQEPTSVALAAKSRDDIRQRNSRTRRSAGAARAHDYRSREVFGIFRDVKSAKK